MTPDLPALRLPDATVLSAAPGARQAHLADRLEVCRRRIGLILGVAIVVTGGVALWSFMQPPVYESKTTVLIDREQKLVPSDVGYVPENNWEWHATQFQLMKSTPVLSEVARRLLNEPATSPPSASLLDGLRHVDDPNGIGNIPSVATASERDAARQGLVNQLRGIIAITPVQGTKLVDIIVHAQDPDFAARAANTVAAVYINRNLESKVQASQAAGQWFSEQLNDLRAKVEQSEHALQAFQLEYGIDDSPNLPNQLEQKLTELNAELVKIELKRADVVSRQQQVQAMLLDKDRREDLAGFLPYLEGGKAAFTEKLILEEARVMEQLTLEGERYSELHPRMLKLQAALDTLRGRLKREIQQSISNELQILGGQEKVLRDTIEKLNHDKVNIDQHRVQYYMLNREAQSNRSLYDLFLKQLKGSDISADVRANNVYVSEPAVPNPSPVSPRKGLNTVVGLLLGLVGGVGSAFFLEYWDRSLKGPDDLARYLPGHVSLGIIPVAKESGSASVERVVQLLPRSQLADSYRAIRTSVLLSSADAQPSSILITSAGAGEGKTTVASNLAIALAQLGHQRVVLVDADLRKPRIENVFRRVHERKGVRQPGLVHYLVGEVELDDVLQPTDVPGLWIIPHGAVPPNPSELLHSDRMRGLVERFKKEGALVVIDSPPVLPVPDAAVLSGEVSGVVMVIRAGETRRERCHLAIQQLQAAGGKILGIIFQQAAPDTMPSYYYDHYNGYYGYGSEQEHAAASRTDIQTMAEELTGKARNRPDEQNGDQ